MLSKKQAEEQEYFTYLQQLTAEGIDIPEEVLERARYLRITIGPDSNVLELPSGVIAYVVQTRLVTRPPLLLQDCEISVPWDDEIVLESFDEREPVCRLGSLKFNREEVLNTRIEKLLQLYSGQQVEGLILATGLNPIPAQYHSGALVQSRLIFRNQFGDEITHGAGLSLQRAERRILVLRLKNGLYAPGLRAEQGHQVCASRMATHRLDSNPNSESNSARKGMPNAAATSLPSHSSDARSPEETLSAIVSRLRSLVEAQSSGTR